MVRRDCHTIHYHVGTQGKTINLYQTHIIIKLKKKNHCNIFVQSEKYYSGTYTYTTYIYNIV